MIDRVVSAFAIAQAILATLKAGAKLVQPRTTAASDRPYILPPEANQTSRLYDLTCVFRQGVKLGLKIDEYATNEYYDVSTSTWTVDGTSSEGYSMSLLPSLKQTWDDRKTGSDTDPVWQSKQLELQEGEDTRLVSLNEQKNDVCEVLRTDYALDVSRAARIQAYGYDCFRQLRSFFGIDEKLFRRTLLESGPYVSFQTNSKGAARTGGVFFLTNDGSFLIKTIKRDEMRALLRMMPKYFDYMKENGRDSLLARFCGIYQVDCKIGNTHEENYFIIMNSVFPKDAPTLISERFDLKGSTLGRQASETEKIMQGNQAVMKDLDLADERDSLQFENEPEKQKNGFQINALRKDSLLFQLQKDVDLLKDCHVIDYSLLVGIATLCNNKSATGRRKLAALRTCLRKILLRRGIYRGSLRCGVNAGNLSVGLGERKGIPSVYYFGIIDFLQPYDTKKALEYQVKSIVHRGATFSCIPPDQYAQRFVAFVNKHIHST